MNAVHPPPTRKVLRPGIVVLAMLPSGNAGNALGNAANAVIYDFALGHMLSHDI